MNGGCVLSVSGNGHGSVGSVRVAENEPLDTHDTHSTPAPRDTHAACHTGRITHSTHTAHTRHAQHMPPQRYTHSVPHRAHYTQCTTHKNAHSTLCIRHRAHGDTLHTIYHTMPMATHATHTQSTVRHTRRIHAVPHTRCHTLTCTTSRTDTPTHTYHTCSVSHATQHTTRLAQLAVTAHYTHTRHKPGKPCRRESSDALAGLTAVFTAAHDGQEPHGSDRGGHPQTPAPSLLTRAGHLTNVRPGTRPC